MLSSEIGCLLQCLMHSMLHEKSSCTMCASIGCSPCADYMRGNLHSVITVWMSPWDGTQSAARHASSLHPSWLFSILADHQSKSVHIDDKQAGEWQSSQLQSAVTIPTSSPVTSVTVHSDSDEIVVGTEQGALLLLTADSQSECWPSDLVAAFSKICLVLSRLNIYIYDVNT